MNIFSDVDSPPQHFIFFSYSNILHWYCKHDKVLCSVCLCQFTSGKWFIDFNLDYMLERKPSIHIDDILSMCLTDVISSVWWLQTRDCCTSRWSAHCKLDSRTSRFFRSNGEIGKSGSCEIFLDFFFNDIPNHSIFHTLHWNYIDIIDGNKLGCVLVEDDKRQKWLRASNSN